MREFQDKNLGILQKVAMGTDYYSQILKEKGLRNFNRENITELGYLSKEILKRYPERLHNPLIRHYNIYKTSGSSGDPIKLRVSLNAEAYRTAGRKRFYEWWAIHSLDRSVLIWGRSISRTGKSSMLRKFKILFHKVTDRVFSVNVFDLSTEDFPVLLKKIRRFNPRYFRGYTSGIEQFADLSIEYKTNLKDLKLKGVIVTSEILSEDQRIKIGSVFGCPVINEYGANDGGLIAFECPSGGMHIFEEALLLNTKSNGEVLLTDLHNHATPLINYELGDRLKLREDSCKCGRRLKIIDIIEGRTGDDIIKSNGQKLNNAFFDYIIRDLDNAGFHDCIKKHKVVQKGKTFDFYFVKGKLFSSEVINHIKSLMFSEIGEDIEINFNEVSEIKREESGKLRDFVREY